MGVVVGTGVGGTGTVGCAVQVPLGAIVEVWVGRAVGVSLGSTISVGVGDAGVGVLALFTIVNMPNPANTHIPI